MQDTIFVVTSTAPPTLLWPCPRCGHRQFVCSERFRMNTNGKLADIWLIYRCGECEATKNLTVVERTAVSRIDPSLFAAATANDPAAARAISRNVSLIKAAGARVAAGDRYAIATDGGAPVNLASGVAAVHLRFPEPLLVRLDEVLATALGISRAKVAAGPNVAVPSSGAPTTQRIDKLRLWNDITVGLANNA